MKASSLPPPLPRILAAAILAALAAGPSLATDAPAAAGPAKEFALYMGADIRMEKDNQLRQVLRAKDRMLAVNIDGRLQGLHIRQVKNLHAIPVLKLSRSVAKIGKFSTEQDYSEAANIRGAWAQSMAFAQEVEYNANNPDLFEKLQPGPEVQTAMHYSAQAAGTPGPSLPEAKPTPPPSVLNYENMRQFADRRGEELTSDNYDLLRLSFEVSAVERVEDPYVVIVADIQDPARPAAELQWFYVELLDDLGPRPQKVRISEYGFPRGFKVLHTAVHLYAGSRELPTNLSESRVEMSREEAYDYLNAQYVTSRRTATQPACPIGLESAETLLGRIPAEANGRVLNLAIDEAGRVTDVKPANPAEPPLTAATAAALASLRFHPALEKGKPVATTLRGEVASLVR